MAEQDDSSGDHSGFETLNDDGASGRENQQTENVVAEKASENETAEERTEEVASADRTVEENVTSDDKKPKTEEKGNEGSDSTGGKSKSRGNQSDKFAISGEAKVVLMKKKEEFEKKMKQSFRLFGVEFAPVALPVERRLQTFAVLFSLVIGTLCPLFLILVMLSLLFTPLFFIPILYGTWMYLDRNTPHRGGRRIQFLRYLPVWRYFRDYFPITLTKTGDLSPSRNYIVGYHPHGILSFGAACNFCSEANNFSKLYPGIKPFLLTLNTQFRWPLIRAYLLGIGTCAVSRESIRYLLTSGIGHAVVIVVGGAEEALEARPGTYTIVLRNRKGFVRQALLYGADLVPCYSFGENDIYKQVENTPGTKVRSFQEWFKRVASFSPPIVYGRGVFNYTFGIMPYRIPIDTVVGNPIRVERQENPSNEAVDHYHQMYMDELYKLFEAHKERHGIPPDAHINFI